MHKRSLAGHPGSGIHLTPQLRDSLLRLRRSRPKAQDAGYETTDHEDLQRGEDQTPKRVELS